MGSLTMLGIATFLVISLLFLLFRSTPLLFHLGCVLSISAFVHVTGRRMLPEDLGEWVLIIVGLVLYWFGLVIVRIMLTRSVSLRILAAYEKNSSFNIVNEGIAARLQDVAHFGLMKRGTQGYRLTLFGRAIAGIVALSYAILRIK